VTAPLAGRVALVTGVSRRIGIGYGVARRLAADGADLMVSSWAPHDEEMPWGGDPDGPDVLAAELRATHRRVEHLAADLADPTAPTAIVDAARGALGHVDVLVANHARSSIQDLRSLTAEEIDHTLAANVRGTLLLVQAWAAQHDGRPGGRVVLFTSGQHRGPMPDELPYVASKGALHQLTASLAAALGDRGITVNCINPGPTDTGYADDAVRAEVARRMPFGRWGTPDDVARLVAWLVSDEGAWVTGAVIDSDGGWSLSR
jgi:3-oxoacyl-[acyl-carrier protein] reductase